MMALEPSLSTLPVDLVSRHSSTAPSASKIRLDGVEAARGVAALLVVLYHAALHVEGNVYGAAVLWGLPHFGHAGVDFFFVLSGFIISFVHRTDLGRPERLGRYLERRITRVFPFYWIVLSFSLLDSWLFHRAQFPGYVEVMSNAFLLPQTRDPIVGGAWTLVFEVIFYLGFAIAICSRRVGAALLWAWIALVLSEHYSQFSSENPAFLVATSPFCFDFFLGIGAAAILARHVVPFSGILLVLGTLGFAIAGLAEVTGILYGFGTIARLVYGAFSTIVILGVVENERSGILRVPRFMTVLGRSSYSIYLVHLIAIGISFKFLSMTVMLSPSWSLAIWALLCTMGFAAGILASILIEQPVIRFVRRRMSGVHS